MSAHGSFVSRSSANLEARKPDEELPLQRSSQGLSGKLATSMNLVTIMVGAGILALPRVYATVGIPLGVALTVLGCSLSVYLCDSLSEAIGAVQARTGCRMRTLEDVGAACYGEVGRRITRFVINFTFIGKASVYFVLIGQNLAYLHAPPMYRGWVVLSSAVFLSLAFVRSVSTLERIAFSGVICSVVYLFMIVFGSFQAHFADVAGSVDLVMLSKIDRSLLLPALSVMLFSFGPTDVLANVRNNMTDQSGMRVALISSHAAVGSFCVIAGSLGFWGFGSGVRDDVTQSMCAEVVNGHCVDGTKWVSGYLLAAAVVINLGISIPIDFYCLFSNIEASYPKEAPMPAGLNLAMRFCVPLFCLTVGLLLPYFMEVLEIFCALLIVPGVIWLPLAFSYKATVDAGRQLPLFRKIFDCGLALLGVACLILGLYKSVSELLEAFRHDEDGRANPFAHRWF